MRLFIFFIMFFVLAGRADAFVIFSDGFESGLSEWSSSGEKWTASGTSSETGVHSGLKRVQVMGNTDPNDDYILKNISTVGRSGIKLQFWYRIYKGLEDEDHVYVEWTSDGASWNIIRDYTDIPESGTWVFESLPLPIEAQDRSGFAIRFRGHLGAASSDIFYLDDVEVVDDDQVLVATPVVTPSSVPITPTPISSTSAASSTPVILAVKATPTPTALILPSPSPIIISDTAKAVNSISKGNETAGSTNLKSENVSDENLVDDANSSEEVISTQDATISDQRGLLTKSSFWIIGLMIVAVAATSGGLRKRL